MFLHALVFTFIFTLFTYEPSLQWPRLRTLQRVILDNWGKNVQIYDYQYDDGLYPKTGIRTNTKIDQRLQQDENDQRSSIATISNEQRTKTDKLRRSIIERSC